MWLAVLVSCLTTTAGITGTYIGPTQYCITATMESYVEAAAIVPLVNDTLVFLAVSWRFMGTERTFFKESFRVLTYGDYTSTLSGALLRDGQAYYL